MFPLYGMIRRLMRRRCIEGKEREWKMGGFIVK